VIGILDLHPHQRRMLADVAGDVLVYYQSPPPDWQVGAPDAPGNWEGQNGPCWVWIGPLDRLMLATPEERADVSALILAGLFEYPIPECRVQLTDDGRRMLRWLLDGGWRP
jgi:hypothetical protein